MRRSLFLIVLLVSGVLFTLSAEESKTVKIPLKTFIEKACSNSHFQEILIKELSLVYKESLKTTAEDLVLSLNAEYGLEYSDDLTHQFSGSVSLSKLFQQWGTKISGGYSFTPSMGASVSSKLNFKIEQDLVRNAFGRVTEVERMIAGYETEIARIQIVEAYEEYLASLISLYLDWYSAYENLQNAEKSLQNNNRLLTVTKNKLKYNIALPVDQDKVELQVVSKQEQVLNLTSAYNLLQFRVKAAMGCDDECPDEWAPVWAPLISDNPSGYTKDLENFTKDSRTSALIRLLNRNRQLSIDIAADALLPSVKLYGGYDLSGDGYFFNSDITHAGYIGVTLGVPLVQTYSQTDYEIKKLDLKETELTNKNKLESVKSDLFQLSERIANENRMLELADRKIALSEAIMKDELKGYDQGRSSLNDLISAYNTMDTNELSKTTHLVLVNKLFVEWMRLTDTLVVKREGEEKPAIQPALE
ncbi:MAG: TolC family protein [Spirochaetales bacterium]|nr:TolC family protein [Spirochaetales bacterium]